RRVLSNSSLLPRRHVHMITIITLASVSGNQPPSITFMRFAERNVASTTMNGTITAMVQASDRPQTLGTTIKARIASTTIVPVTAMPYADASAVDERNSATNSSTPTKIELLTRGM